MIAFSSIGRSTQQSEQILEEQMSDLLPQENDMISGCLFVQPVSVRPSLKCSDLRDHNQPHPEQSNFPS